MKAMLVQTTLVTAAAWLGLTATALADGSLRCGKRLVSKGETTAKALSLCGEPATKAQRRVTREVTRVVYGPCAPGSAELCAQQVRESVEVMVEDWTYDFGPDRLMRTAIFEDGKLVRVESGGYGGDR